MTPIVGEKDLCMFKTSVMLIVDVQESVKQSTLHDLFLPISFIPFEEIMSLNFL